MKYTRSSAATLSMALIYPAPSAGVFVYIEPDCLHEPFAFELENVRPLGVAKEK